MVHIVEDPTQMESDAPPEDPVAAWLRRPLAQKLAWHQSSSEVFATLTLPRPVRARDIQVTFGVDRLRIEIPVLGAFLDEKLHRKIHPGESFWSLSDLELQLCMGKAGPVHAWAALFDRPDENALAKSHRTVLKELVESTDEPAGTRGYDKLDDESRDLLEEMLDRQGKVASGERNLESDFDDFRLPLGSGMY